MALPPSGHAITVTAGKLAVAKSVIPVAPIARPRTVSVAPWTATGGEQVRSEEADRSPKPAAVAPLTAAWAPVALIPRPMPAVRGTERSVFGTSLTDDALGLDLWPAVGLKAKRSPLRA